MCLFKFMLRNVNNSQTVTFPCNNSIFATIIKIERGWLLKLWRMIILFYNERLAFAPGLVTEYG